MIRCGSVTPDPDPHSMFYSNSPKLSVQSWWRITEEGEWAENVAWTKNNGVCGKLFPICCPDLGPNPQDVISARATQELSEFSQPIKAHLGSLVQLHYIDPN